MLGHGAVDLETGQVQLRARCLEVGGRELRLSPLEVDVAPVEQGEAEVLDARREHGDGLRERFQGGIGLAHPHPQEPELLPGLAGRRPAEVLTIEDPQAALDAADRVAGLGLDVGPRDLHLCVHVDVVGESCRLFQVAVRTRVVADVGCMTSAIEELFGARHAPIIA